MKKSALIVLALIVCTSFAAEQKYNLDVDFARFRASDSENFVEIYYNLYPQQWTFTTNSEGDSTATAIIDFVLYHGEDLIDLKRWQMPHTKGDDTIIGSVKMDLLRYSLSPGKYNVDLKAADLANPSLSDSVRFEINNMAFTDTSVALSDLQLCYSIKNAAPNSNPAMIKNNLEVFPNPTSIYSQDSPILYFYLELYNLSNHIKQGQYTINYWVADLADQKVGKIRDHYKKRKKIHDSSVEIGHVNLSSLPSGNYWLYFSIADSGADRMTVTRSRFQLHNPARDQQLAQMQQATTDKARLAFVAKPISEIEKELEYLIYIAPKETYDIVRTLNDPETKRNYLANFWKEHDPIPATVDNEFRSQFLERINYANDNYAAMDAGWESDRGRIYILYGKPSDIQRSPSTPEGRAHQIWTYDQIQGGAIFVFVDMEGFGRYQLVHSTLRGEIHNFNWQKMVAIAPPFGY